MPVQVSRTIGIALLHPMLALVTGCGGYKQVDPNYDFEAPPEPCPQETVRVGDVVKLVLKNGDKIQGEVLQVGPETLSFGKPSNYGYQKYSVAFSDIESLEVWRQSQTEAVVAGTVGALMAITMGMVILFALSFRGANLS